MPTQNPAAVYPVLSESDHADSPSTECRSVTPRRDRPRLTRSGGPSPPRTPFAFARGAPRSPLRSGGRARGAPSPLCDQQQRVQSSRFEPHNGLTIGYEESSMSSFFQDLRYGWRTLGKSPGFAAVAVLTLALGIGANTAIFSFVDGVLLKPLPYRDADRIVRVLEKPPHGDRNGISTLNFLDWQKDNAVFDFMAAQAGGPATLTGSGDPVQLRGARVSARYFEIFGIQAERGRTFRPDED